LLKNSRLEKCLGKTQIRASAAEKEVD